jgi:hypothetical protein
MEVILCREKFSADLAKQVETPVYFVDFLREPVCDPETGEVVDGHPSYYESIPAGLPDIRSAFSKNSRLKIFAPLLAVVLLHFLLGPLFLPFGTIFLLPANHFPPILAKASFPFNPATSTSTAQHTRIQNTL